MRSIDVRVEPTVRLVREGEGVENTEAFPCILIFDCCMLSLAIDFGSVFLWDKPDIYQLYRMLPEYVEIMVPIGKVCEHASLQRYFPRANFF